MVLIFHTKLFDSIRHGDIKSVETFLDRNVYYSLFLTLVIMIIQNTFTIIPILLVITMNITLYGFLFGFLWSWVSSVIAATLVFFAIRYCFQDWVLRKTDPKLIMKMEQRGFMYVFQGRVFPFVPTSIINIIAGVSSIPFHSFILATMIGNFLYFFVLSLLSVGILSVNLNEYFFLIFIFLTIFIFYIFQRITKGRKQQKLLEADSLDREDIKE